MCKEEYDFRLSVHKLVVEAEMTVRLCELEVKALRITSGQQKAVSLPALSSKPTFDTSNNIAVVPPLRESDVDLLFAYFGAFDSCGLFPFSVS